MKCLNCSKNKANKHPILGYLPCDNCQISIKLKTPVEFTTENIKYERKKFADDIMQSSRGGVLNKRFIDKYGTSTLKVTQEQIDNARDVYAGEVDSIPYRENDGKVI